MAVWLELGTRQRLKPESARRATRVRSQLERGDPDALGGLRRTLLRRARQLPGPARSPTASVLPHLLRED